jgi:hypothetical protein
MEPACRANVHAGLLRKPTPTKQLPPSAAGSSRRAWLLRCGWFIVGVGSALRILQYAANRSLSIDESFLALNLISKSPRELLQSLAFNQAAPLGFLEAEKLTLTIFGRSEYALRLLPLLASLLALVVFYELAQRVLSPLGAIGAVAVFAFLDPLIYYSGTAKQYAFDVVSAVVLLGVAVLLEARPLRRVDFAMLVLLGVILVWFSHASVFCLAGVGAVLGLRLVESRDRTLRLALLGTIGVWVGSFLVEFLLSRSNLTRIVGSFGEGGDGFLTPGQGGSSWFDRSADRLRYLAGLEDTASGDPIFASLSPGVNRGLTVLILIVAAIGFVSLLRRRTRIALVLALPPMLAAAASALNQYPLVGRTLLFALPAVALCIGEGMQILVSMTTSRWIRGLAAVVVACLTVIAILPAVHVVRPRKNEEMKQALAYLGLHHRRSDVLYVSAGAQYAFAYYHLCGCSSFDPAAAWPLSAMSGKRRDVALESRSPNLIIERSPITDGDMPSAARSLIGRSRVWLLFAEAEGYEEKPLLGYLDRHGTRLRTFRASGPSAVAASLYLYDLARRGRR